MSNEFQLGLFDAMPEPDKVTNTPPTTPVDCEPLIEATPSAPSLPEGYSLEFAIALQKSLCDGLSQLVAHGELIPSLGDINPRTGKAEGAIFYVSKRDFDADVLNESFADLKYSQDNYIPFEASFIENSLIIEADGLYDSLGDQRFEKLLNSACKLINERTISITNPDFDSLNQEVNGAVQCYKDEIKRQREGNGNTNEPESISA